MHADPVVEDILNNHPLSVFSLFIDIQSRTVRGLGQEILTCLEAGISPDDGTGGGTLCDGGVITRG